MKKLFNQFLTKRGFFQTDDVEPSIDRLEDGRGEIRAGLYALAIFLGIILAWGSFVQLDAAIAAEGVVTVSGNRQGIQHKEGGTIARINVRDGQSVRRRDILIELNAPEVRAQEQALFAQSIHLQLQRALFLAEEAGASSLDQPRDWALLTNDDKAAALAALVQYQKGIRSAALTEYGARIVSYRKQLAAIDRQISLLTIELETMQSLADEQLAPLTRVRALERALAALQGSHADLTGQIAMARQERAQSLRRIEGHIAEILPQLTAARARLEATRLRAPIDGVVVGLTANTLGGVIAPGERVMDIVPDNPELIVEARIRPEDADDVAPMRIIPGSSEAYYRPSTDTIHLPPFERFVDAQTAIAVTLHECAHATGAPHRLDRDLSGRFGSHAYAMEEAVAELTASFVLADLSIAHEPRPDHAAYLSSWLTVLKDDPSAIFTAASKAQAAADWMNLRQVQVKAAA